MSLKEVRLKLNMSQSEFASYLNIPVANICHWEQGYRNPPDYVVGLIKRVVSLEQNIDI